VATRLPPTPYAKFADLDSSGGPLVKALGAESNTKLLAKFTLLIRTRVAD
jgi:hypothetical protein